MPEPSRSVQVVRRSGHDLLHLTSEDLSVEVLPGKGGDIVSIRWRPLDLNVLWETPWGLRPPAALPASPDSQVAFLESYPGGWQTLFPNGGTATMEQGVELPFHGEATAVAWDWEPRDLLGGAAVELWTCLVRSPFRLRRLIEVVGATVTVTEHITNESGVSQQAMWSHHPAFGAPFLDASCVLRTAGGAFLADPDYDTEHGDLTPGARSGWPQVAGRAGGVVDLSTVPAPDAGVDRFGYLLDLPEPWFALTNPTLDLTVTVRWDGSIFPHAWYWCEAGGTTGFPWHQRAYVLAVEPASSYPGAGLQAARESGTALTFAPGETRTAFVCLELRQGGATSG